MSIKIIMLQWAGIHAMIYFILFLTQENPAFIESFKAYIHAMIYLQ
jgi:hypothetical protein